MQYALHPLSTLFPRLVGAEFDSLVADIKANGLREPIVLHGGTILDGGNRAAACEAAGVDPQYVEFLGGNIVTFVLSANLHRRHLSPGQAAAIVASAQDWAKAQTVGNPQFGNVTGLATVADRMDQSGASDKTQRQADKVAKADPDLAKQVAHGVVTLPAAVAKVEGKPKATSKPKPKLLTEEESALILAENARLQEVAETLAKDAGEAIADNESMAKIFESDDQLAAALQENDKLRAEVRMLRERFNGKMNECAELNRLLNKANRRLASLEGKAAA